MVEIEIEPTEIKERKADSKGRVAIGPEYSGQTVTVAVISTEDE